ncbi:MAG TPA: hypothetical protein VFU69_02825 [Ktedonobacterales bacterium]|nr:hypothetical protein [Ktedonobacterales bacterium]
MAGLRDGLQRSRELYLPESDRPRDAAKPFPPSRTRSLPQRVNNIGFSIHSAEDQSAWKRRFGQRATAPTETTVRTTLLLRCALLHSLFGILLACGLTVLFLESMNGSWLWLLLLTMLIASYGVAAYWCAERFGRLPLACWVILIGDLAALVSAWLLIGPSLALALLLPGIAVLALLLAGRREMLITASLEAAALVVLALADLAGLPHLSFHAPTALLVLLNLFGALACLGGMIYALLAVLNRSAYMGYSDHWNSAEIARVRIESDIHLRQLQESILTLQAVLGRVDAGDLRARVAIKDGELAPIAARLNSLLNRQERMFDEARQHRRLEAATGELLALLEALHRGERVGWPAPTGTQVDRILALMRAPLAPRPRVTRELPVVLPPSESD